MAGFGKRWLDYAVQTPKGTTAVELEFSLKATRRLYSIVYGYQEAPQYDFVDFVLLERKRDGQLWRTLTRLVDDALMVPSLFKEFRFGPTMNVRPWPDPLPELHEGIALFPSICVPRP
jgi:hypothetical protein